MMLKPRTREEMAHDVMCVLAARGETFVHETGLHQGKPLGRRRVQAMVAEFIREQKRSGKLVERRPYVEARSKKRGIQYVAVPQTLDLFQDL